MIQVSRVGFAKIKTAKNASEGSRSVSAKFHTIGNFPRYGSKGVNSPVSTITKSFSELMNFLGSFVPKASPFLPSFAFTIMRRRRAVKKGEGLEAFMT